MSGRSVEYSVHSLSSFPLFRLWGLGRVTLGELLYPEEPWTAPAEESYLPHFVHAQRTGRNEAARRIASLELLGWLFAARATVLPVLLLLLRRRRGKTWLEIPREVGTQGGG